MHHATRYILVTLLVLSTTTTWIVAQNSTASPYSMFGYGELNDNVPGAYRGLGGVSIGMRSKTVINPSQPASYSAIDNTTFMFDLAASAMVSTYKDASGRRTKGNGNLEYLTLQFPIWKYIGVSLGIMPYSAVGYEMTDSVASFIHPYKRNYSGTGGISEVYAGISFNIMNWAALGMNVYYMFGDIENNKTLSFTESGFNKVSQVSTMHVSDVRLRYGAQLFHTFAEKHTVVLGATFENKTKLNGRFSKIETTTTDTVQNTATGFELPMSWGVGASYNYADRMTFAIDYSAINWADALYFGNKGAFRNRSKLAMGFEYRHNPMGRKYVERMPFRVGCSLSDPYLTNINAKEFSVSVGVGFPLRNVATVINTIVEYGHRGTKGTLEENYFKFTINASVSENWFFKRKL